MTINIFTPGIDAKAEEVNSNFNESLIISGLNLIRQVQNREVDFSKGGFDWFATKLTNVSNAKSDSTAFFNLDKFTTILDITNTGTTTTNRADGENAFSRTDSYTYLNQDKYTGKTFTTDTYIGKIYIKYYNDSNSRLQLQSYDGSTWTELIQYTDEGMQSKIYEFNNTTQGIRLFQDDSNDYARIHHLMLGSENVAETLINLNIPSGIFNNNISSLIGVPFIEDYEDGCNIQIKVTNATEDSGWVDYNKIGSFTAFTSEPTQCIIKLIPKNSNPTIGVPSIKGFALRCS